MKCADCGREESILPRRLSVESCVSNLREDVSDLRERLAEAVRLMERAEVFIIDQAVQLKADFAAFLAKEKEKG